MWAEAAFRCQRMKMTPSPERPGGASRGLTCLLPAALLSPGVFCLKRTNPTLVSSFWSFIAQSRSGKHVWKAGGSGGDFQSWSRGQWGWSATQKGTGIKSQDAPGVWALWLLRGKTLFSTQRNVAVESSWILHLAERIQKCGDAGKGGGAVLLRIYAIFSHTF